MKSIKHHHSFIIILLSLIICTQSFGRLPSCELDGIVEALPYAQIVEANAHDALHEAHSPGYRPLRYDELPASIQAFGVEQAITNAADLAAHEWLIVMGNGSIDDEDAPEENIVDTHSIEFMGVFARIYICDAKEEIVLAFRGTEQSPEDNPMRFALNWMTNTFQSLGLPSLAYEFAADLAHALTQEFPNHTILCTGISLGGGLAHYAAAINGLSAYCFNSPHLANDTLTNIMNTLLGGKNPEAFIQNIEDNIHHIHIRGDILQDIISLIPGKKLGNQCAVPPHEGLTQKSSNILKKLKNKIQRHFIEHLVPSLRLFIDKATN